MIADNALRPATSKKVLVVEDEGALRFVITILLRDIGLEVVEAENAHTALEQIKADQDIALVFTDVRMPGAMDGLGLARLLNTEFPQIKVIVTSGNLMPGEIITGMPFFPKPYAVLDVADKIVKTLETV